MSPTAYGSPAIPVRVFGRSWGGFFSDYCSVSSTEHVWGEGGMSFQSDMFWWAGTRISTSHGDLGS